jgi:hypothetical protein
MKALVSNERNGRRYPMLNKEHADLVTISYKSNKESHPAAAPFYLAIHFVNLDGYIETGLLTKDDIMDSLARGKRNPEDCPKPNFMQRAYAKMVRTFRSAKSKLGSNSK